MAGFALNSKNFAYGWGRNNAGQIGNGNTTDTSSPVALVGGHRFLMLSNSTQNGVGLNYNGKVYCWGNQTNGAVGNNTNTGTQPTPQEVAGNHSFVFVTGNRNGAAHFALKSDGSAWAWGLGSNGQLGDNSTVTKSSPVSVVGNHSFIQICSGGGATFGLKSDGSAWAWGDATSGHLGDNTITNKSSPVALVGGHSFIQISCTSNSGCGLKADGSVWCWGRNNNGQLGDNTVINKSAPVAVVGSHSFIQIAGNGAGGGGTIAGLKADGSIWTWGTGTLIGDNTITNKSSPVSVVGNHSFVKIGSADLNNFFARKANGELWGWGNNTVGSNIGAIGDNTITSRSSPVLVVGNYNWAAVLDEKIALATVRSLTITSVNGSVTNDGNGELDELGNLVFSDGETIHLTATPDVGYEFSSWSGDASGSSNPLTVLMNSDKNITANFTTASSDSSGFNFFYKKLLKSIHSQWLLDLFSGKTFRKIP